MFFCIVWLLLASISTFAQSTQAEVEMADTMRAQGKIYVIVAIILIVLIGMITYLFTLDRKVTRLEARLKNVKD